MLSPYAGHEVPLTWGEADGSAPRTGYFTFTCEAHREENRVAGITVFGYDATEQVLTAHNGQEALSLLARCGHAVGPPFPALVLLDLHMPVLGGLDFLTA